MALVLACSFLYAWGSREAGHRSESETRSHTLEQQVATLTQQQALQAQDTRTVIRTKVKPDGTKTVTETKERLVVHEDSSSRVDSQSLSTQESTAKTEAPDGPDLSRYSLELDWHPTVPSLTPYLPEEVHVGARIGNLPLWLTVGAEHLPDGRFLPTLGMRWEF